MQPNNKQILSGGCESNADKRSLRRRVLKGVKVAFNGEFCSVNGIVKNVSETGMFIELKDGFIVPDEIVIYNELEAYKVPARVVRREANRIGIEICGEREPIEQTRTQIVQMVNVDEDMPSVAPVSKAEEPECEKTQIVTRQNKPVFGKLGPDPK